MNSALMVLEPSLDVYADLIAYLNSDPSGTGESFIYGDQQLIETFFSSKRSAKLYGKGLGHVYLEMQL